MQALCKGFCQAVGQGFEHDRRVVVVVVGELLLFLLDADACGDGKEPDVIGLAALGRHKISQAAIGAFHAVHHRPLGLQTQGRPPHQHLAARLVGVDLDRVVVHGVGGQELEDTVGAEPAAFNGALQEAFAVRKNARGLTAHDVVAQDVRELAGQVPGLKKRRPVNACGQLGQVVVAQNASPNKAGAGRRVSQPVHRCLVGPGLLQSHQRRDFFAGVLCAHTFVVQLQVSDVLGSALVT